MNKRDLVDLVEKAGLQVEGNETADELTEALGYLLARPRV
jgi:hypothetical protein